MSRECVGRGVIKCVRLRVGALSKGFLLRAGLSVVSSFVAYGHGCHRLGSCIARGRGRHWLTPLLRVAERSECVDA